MKMWDRQGHVAWSGRLVSGEEQLSVRRKLLYWGYHE